MKISVKFPIFLFLFAIILIPAISQGALDDLNKNNINSIKAIVGDEIITREDVLRRAVVAIKEAQGKYKEEEFIEKVEEILKNTLYELIDRKVLVKEAQRIFGTNEAMMKEIEKDLESFMKGAVKNVGSLSKYYEIAESQGINPVEKRNELKEDIMIDKIIKENVYNRVKIQPKSLRRYYCENISEFHQEKEVHLRHIMIKFSAHGNNKDEALSIARQVIKRLQEGEDFIVLAKKYSEGPNTENGGLMSPEETNELRKDLRDIACNLKDNEYSKILESPVGYHIFKMELNRPEMIQPFETVQDEIYKKLYKEEISRLKKQYLDSLKAGLFIKVYN
jgi:parvulin-like peptidyl-prolyl isomerase